MTDSNVPPRLLDAGRQLPGRLVIDKEPAPRRVDLSSEVYISKSTEAKWAILAGKAMQSSLFRKSASCQVLSCNDLE